MFGIDKRRRNGKSCGSSNGQNLMGESKDINKILVINLGGIGDVLISTPALRALKEHFSGARLYLLAVPRGAEVARSLAYVDKVFVFEANRPILKIFSNLVNILELRKLKVDLAINMRTIVSGSSAAKMGWIMNLIRPGKKAGRDTAGRGNFLDIKIREDDIGEKYEMDYDVETVQALGAQVKDRKIDFLIEPNNLERAEEVLKNQGINKSDIVIGIHPGGKPSHRWPGDNFAEVIKAIARENPSFKFVITGSADENELAGKIIDKSGIKASNLAGKLSIRELAVLLKRCDLYITNDTGSMHIAAIMNTPLVAIFGPGYFKRYDPRNIYPQAEVLCKEVDCSPCNKSFCGSMKCLEFISTVEVVLAAKRLLNRKKGQIDA
jgi:ADP-heptose:LPS heptosyltransferase